MVSVIKGSTVFNSKGMKIDNKILTFSRYSDARVSKGMEQFAFTSWEKRGRSDNVQWLHTFISCIKFASSTITLVCNYRRWNDILVFTSHSPCRCTFLVTSNLWWCHYCCGGKRGKWRHHTLFVTRHVLDIVAIESPFQLYRTHFNPHASVILEWPMSQVTLHNKHMDSELEAPETIIREKSQVCLTSEEVGSW